MENKDIEISERLRVIEAKVLDITNELSEIKERLKNKTDKNAVKVIVDESVFNKGLIDEDEVIILIQRSENKIESTINKMQINLIKWIIATSISTASLTVALLRFFI